MTIFLEFSISLSGFLEGSILFDSRGKVAVDSLFVFHTSSEDSFQISGFSIHIGDAVERRLSSSVIFVEDLNECGVVIAASVAHHLDSLGVVAVDDAVSVMLEVINKCFPQQVKAWEPKLKEMIPSYGQSLVGNPELIQEVHASTAKALGLNKNVQDEAEAKVLETV